MISRQWVARLRFPTRRLARSPSQSVHEQRAVELPVAERHFPQELALHSAWLRKQRSRRRDWFPVLPLARQTLPRERRGGRRGGGAGFWLGPAGPAPHPPR